MHHGNCHFEAQYEGLEAESPRLAEVPRSCLDAITVGPVVI